MTPNELRKLLAQDENPKLDFKIDCSLTRDEEWNELIKDILALANGNVGFSRLPGYLVIGAGDAKKPDGSRDLKDASGVPLKKKDLLAKINGVCTPRLPNLDFEWGESDGVKILVITIPPTPHLYEIKTLLQTPKRRFQEQTVFIRCGEEIQPATQQERDEILADKRRAAAAREKSVEPLQENRSWELITDPNLILPKLYHEEDNDDPLAYHRIPYQPRDPERDIQLELRTALSQTRYLLITGRSGLGKTREAAMLARALMLEGYRVVRIKRGLLDVPREFPRELQENHRRILIVADDLNYLFRTGEPPKPRRIDEVPAPTLASYHDRLLDTLVAFERWCGESEIRVIATARDDTESWQVLDFHTTDQLWKRFTRFDLPAPKDHAVVDLLKAELASGNVQAEQNDFDGIARENDGTFANVVSNLRRVRMTEQKLTRANYIPTLEGSWRDVYEGAVAKQPAMRYVYDAIDLLQQVEIELFLWVVEPTALLLWEDEKKAKTTRERQISRAVKYLTQEKIIVVNDNSFAPRDRQIEAKGYQIKWRKYAYDLHSLIMHLTSKYGRELTPSLEGFGLELLKVKQFSEAETLFRKSIELGNQTEWLLANFGAALDGLHRYHEAETMLVRAIEHNPQSAYAHFRFGCYLYGHDRIAESTETLRRAIEIAPDFAEAHGWLGLALQALGHYEASKIEFRHAIELDPEDYFHKIGMGICLGKMGISSESDEVFRQIVQSKPNDVRVWVSLAYGYIDLMRYAEAESTLRQALQLNPDDCEAHVVLGVVLQHQEKYIESEAAFRRVLQLCPYIASYHNLFAGLLAKLDRNNEAEAEYIQAIKIGPPKDIFYIDLGALLNKLKRWSEAEEALQKALEINPDSINAQVELGIALANLGRNKEAEFIIQNLSKIASGDAKIHFHLISLFDALDRKEEQNAEFRLFVELDTRITIDPPLDFDGYLWLASYCRKQNYSSDLTLVLNKARRLAKKDDWINRARLESVSGNIEASFNFLLRASEQGDFDPFQAYQDEYLQWIRDDPRFSEIVVLPTETDLDGEDLDDE